MLNTKQKQRQRAPSKRSLETRARILDAAETVFSEHGFDGASIRDIATRAGVQTALVNHHGGSKDELFFTVVARRAEPLSHLRVNALAAREELGPLDLRSVLACFLEPFLHKVFEGGAHWRAYGRLIAHVSTDERWREIAERCFDPTVEIFITEIRRLLPNASRAQIGACFVFMVSSMLSICASLGRIETLGRDQEGISDSNATPTQMIETLLDFCEAGFLAISPLKA